MVWDLQTAWHIQAGRRNHTKFSSEIPICAHKLLYQSHRQHCANRNDASGEAGGNQFTGP